jgi:hypothetical protein
MKESGSNIFLENYPAIFLFILIALLAVYFIFVLPSGGKFQLQSQFLEVKSAV